MTSLEDDGCALGRELFPLRFQTAQDALIAMLSNCFGQTEPDDIAPAGSLGFWGDLDPRVSWQRDHGDDQDNAHDQAGGNGAKKHRRTPFGLLHRQ